MIAFVCSTVSSRARASFPHGCWFDFQRLHDGRSVFPGTHIPRLRLPDYLIHQARSNVLHVRIESPNMEHNTRATSSAPAFISSSTGGTGSRFARAVTIVAGAAALVATILTFL
jgi:hypothetical protein